MTEQTANIQQYAIMGAGISIIIALIFIAIVSFISKKRKKRKQLKEQAREKKLEALPKTEKNQKKEVISQEVMPEIEVAQKEKEVLRNKQAAQEVEAARRQQMEQEAEAARRQQMEQEAEVARRQQMEQEAEVARRQQMEQEAEAARRRQMVQEAEVARNYQVVQNQAEIKRHKPLVLTLKDISSKGITQPITTILDQQVLIGRSKEKNDLALEMDMTVSSKHCKIYRQDELIYIMDLNSTNGTKVNGKVIQRTVVLENEDEVQIGQTVYRVMIK